MTDAYEDASRRLRGSPSTQEQHPAGAKWYASRNDARDLVPEIRELVAEYDRCMRASFLYGRGSGIAGVAGEAMIDFLIERFVRNWLGPFVVGPLIGLAVMLGGLTAMIWLVKTIWGAV